jgi:hypothetical protein
MAKAERLESGDFRLILSEDEALTVMASLFVLLNGDNNSHIVPSTRLQMMTVTTALKKAGLTWQK